jgi:hypothetical protein
MTECRVATGRALGFGRLLLLLAKDLRAQHRTPVAARGFRLKLPLLQLPLTPSVNVLVQCCNLLLAVTVSPVQEALCSAGKIYLQANHTDA